MRIYDARFKYVPAVNTNIASTWKKFGFKPTTDAEREARQKRLREEPAATVKPPNVMSIVAAKTRRKS